MLTGGEIRAASLIRDGLDGGYRASSYDVSIGHVIAPNGSVCETYDLPPQGIVQVVSRERICVPPDITGVATVKTSLCGEGVLALSIGIVDPGYEGPVSSFLVNFGNSPRLLTTGETFLRLQFSRIDRVAVPPARVDDAAYIRERRIQATRIGGTFLNLGTVIETTTDNVFAAWRNRILAYVGSFALLLALLTYLLNFGTFQLVKGWLQPTDTVRADILRGALLDENARLARTNDELARRVSALEQATRSLPSSAQPLGKATPATPGTRP